MAEQTDTELQIDPEIGGNYPEWLYDHGTVATSDVNTFDDVTDDHVQQFHDSGYLVVRNAFTHDETSNALKGLQDLIEGKNPAFTGHQFEKEVEDRIDRLGEKEKQKYMRKLMYHVEFDQSQRDMAFHQKLNETVQRIIGEDDLSMFQDMALLKPPRVGREKPWHQDLAYFNLPLDTTVVGAWIALDKATVENGCMIIVPGSHKKGAVIHFKRRDWQICDTEVMNDVAVAVPLKPGGCLLFHGLIHHGTPANLTDAPRRALQFHYRSARIESTSDQARMAAFGSEGKNVSC